MSQVKFNNHKIYYNFLNSLAKDLTSFYNKKLDKKFKIKNKIKGKGYDPVTTSDKAFEKFIRSKINLKFPDHNIIGEEFGNNKNKSEYSWIIDPIDGTRSYVIGSPTWSNLISLNYKTKPVMGLANFPMLKKYYINYNDKIAYVFENNKKRKLLVNKKIKFKDIKVAAGFHGAISLNEQKKIPKILKLINFPCSDALSYAQICEGRLDAVMQCNNKIWDIHPLIPIIKASGGVATTWDNKDAKYGGNVLVSSNRKNHKKMLNFLKPLL